MWMREYVFNVLIQPFHLIIYTILVGSAMTLAQTSMIYAVVAISFLIPAEKLLRKFFGFDSAGTLSAAGSFAGGALFSAMINKVNRPKGGKGGSGGEGESKPVRKVTPSGLVPGNQLVAGTNGNGIPGTEGARVPGTGNTGMRKRRRRSSEQMQEQEFGANAGAGVNPQAGGVAGSGGNAGGGGVDPSSAGRTSGNSTYSNSAVDRFLARADLARQGLGRRAGNAISSYAYSRYRRLADSARTLPKSAGRLVRRTAVGAYGAATLGLAGAAIGMASGDPNNAIKLATAGGAAGASFANYYGDRYAKGFVQDLKGAETSFWGKDMRQIEAERYDANWMRNARNRDAMTKAMGDRSAVDQAIKDGTIQEFLNNGHTDPGKIGKGLKLYKQYQGRTNAQGQRYTNEEAMKMAIASLNLNRTVSDRVLDPYSRERAAFVRKFESISLYPANVIL